MNEGLRSIPDKIGPYKIEALLERGGMSILYLGIHPVTRDPTTIKVLSPKYVSQPEAVSRFIKEAEIIALADHPNIVRLYGHGEWEGGLYIAMEFIQGVSLRNYLLQTPLSLRRALEIIIDIAYALCHLHTHGVIHRDLKPENILVTDNGAIKVIDFGIAQLLQEPATQQAATQQGLIGTPIYMSPEQCDRPAAVGYPSDIYSLGIIAYELILSKLSFGQIHLALMPKGLQKVLAKALQPNPFDRYRDIVDFITDISAYLHSGALEKDHLAGERISELYEQLIQTYRVLLPPPPLWPQLECGIVIHKIGQLAAGFYEFFHTHDGGMAFFAGTSSAQGAKGILYTSIFRGIVKALHHSHRGRPQDLITAINQVLATDQINALFACAYLILYPSQQLCYYTSYGYGTLLYLQHSKKHFQVIPPPHNFLLGTQDNLTCNIVTQPWEAGDTLVWWGQPPSLEGPPPVLSSWRRDWWIEPFLEHPHTSMQKELESAYRRAKAQDSELWVHQPLNLIGIYHL